jgi:lipoprotein-anchoring transpeptidase ErfK/SrfK
MRIGAVVAASAILLGIGGVGAALLTARAPVPARHAVQPVPKRVPKAPAIAPAAIGRAAPVATAAEPYRVRHILPIDHAMAFGEWHWDETGAPRDGAIVITVDLKAQVLSVFRGGWEIGTAVVLYGAGQTPTPLGVFGITQKDADHHSNIYGGAPMPFMLRLTNDGVSIHGSLVAQGYATHGCVGTPRAFARKLFGVVKLGDKVIVTNGETLDVGQAITAA